MILVQPAMRAGRGLPIAMTTIRAKIYAHLEPAATRNYDSYLIWVTVAVVVVSVGGTMLHTFPGVPRIGSG